jgi:hypothetical protein
MYHIQQIGVDCIENKNEETTKGENNDIGKYQRQLLTRFKMVIDVTLAGACLGLTTQLLSNGMCKLPLMRHPWEHVIGMGLGALFTNQLILWEAKLQEDLDKKLAEAKAANRRRFSVSDEDLATGLSRFHWPLHRVGFILNFTKKLLGLILKAKSRARP